MRAFGFRFPPFRSTARISRSGSTEPADRERSGSDACISNREREIDAASLPLHPFLRPSPGPGNRSRCAGRPEKRRGGGSNLDPLGRGRSGRAKGCSGHRIASCAPTEEFFSGYDDDPVALLQRTFEETNGYDEIVVLKDIRFESHCEHHIAPIIGKVHVAYLPDKRVVGISKLARLVDVYAKRLQIQEKMTAQIANTLDEVLQPKGVAVVIEAAHQCMTTRGVHKPGVTMVTSRMLGAFRDDPLSRREVLAMIGTPGGAKLDNV